MLIASVVAVGMLSGVAAVQLARSTVSGATVPNTTVAGGGNWQEIAWPFPRDGWPAGRAFRSDGVELYVRPKIGFCNCDSGVADDDEVDRVADLDLMSDRFAPLEPGRVVRMADMSGRFRAYHLDMSDGSQHVAVGFALSRRCDLMVAVAQGKGDAAGVQHAALDFLGSADMTRWMKLALSGG